MWHPRILLAALVPPGSFAPDAVAQEEDQLQQMAARRAYADREGRS